METVYDVLKGFADPVFIIFILLVFSLIFLWEAGKKKTGVLILLLVIILFYGASVFPIANHLCRYLEKDYIGQSVVADNKHDAIVVLGGGAYDINYIGGTFPSLFTVARLTYAVDYYHNKPAKYFVCSGKGPGNIPEAEMMAQLAASFGVPKNKIKIDAISANTWQSAIEVSKMFDNKSMNIILITSAYHMKRSEKEFKKYFKNVFPAPANYLYSSPMRSPVIRYFPQTESLHKTSIVFREIVARIWYMIK
ncbi:MAG TPA: YdcF family protein [Deltaproteobacteria bacterium]|nr:YdcF family protein [Deltaproteobacteria bacterium]